MAKSLSGFLEAHKANQLLGGGFRDPNTLQFLPAGTRTPGAPASVPPGRVQAGQRRNMSLLNRLLPPGRAPAPNPQDLTVSARGRGAPVNIDNFIRTNNRARPTPVDFTVSAPSRATPPVDIDAGIKRAGQTTPLTVSAPKNKGARKLLRSIGKMGRGKAGAVGAGLFFGTELLLSLIPGAESFILPDAQNTADFLSGKTTQETLQNAMRQKAQQDLFQAKTQRIRGDIQANMQAIRRDNPALYQELLVGRRLPNGAAVFGGGVRPDILEQVAMQMASGQFQVPENAQVKLSGTLGALQQQQLDQLRFSTR